MTEPAPVDGVVLRPCVPADGPALAAMYSADRSELDASRYPPAQSFFTSAGQLERIGRVWVESNTLGFVIGRGDQIIGLVMLEDVTDGTTTIGYYVASAARRAGLAVWAVSAVAARAFGELGIDRITADIEPDNAASLIVVERAGFLDRGLTDIDGVTHRRWVISSPSS